MSKDSNIDPDEKGGNSVPAPGVSPSSTTENGGPFTSLRFPNFRLLFTGSVLAYAIQWIQQVILSWLAYNITGSGTILGTVTLVMAAASLCGLLVVGILVDYFNRRKVMLIETIGTFAVTAALGLVLFTGHTNIAYLFVFSFFIGFIQNIDGTIRRVLVFDIVPRAQTPAAISLTQTGWSLMRVAGPSIAGFLLLWFGRRKLSRPGRCLCAHHHDHYPDEAAGLEKGSGWASPLRQIKDGVGYLFKQPVTRVFTLIGIILPILVIPIFSTLPPIYAVKVFGDESGKVLGFLMASIGVGGIIGGVVTTYMRRLEHWGLIQMASLFLLSLALIAFTFSSYLPVAMALLAVAGFFELIFLNTNQVLIQLAIPDKLRGRVTAAISLTWILTPLGSLLAGAGSDFLGGPKSDYHCTRQYDHSYSDSYFPGFSDRTELPVESWHEFKIGAVKTSIYPGWSSLNVLALIWFFDRYFPNAFAAFPTRQPRSLQSISPLLISNE